MDIPDDRHLAALRHRDFLLDVDFISFISEFDKNLVEVFHFQLAFTEAFFLDCFVIFPRRNLATAPVKF